jgi:hypothetical protein
MAVKTVFVLIFIAFLNIQGFNSLYEDLADDQFLEGRDENEDSDEHDVASQHEFGDKFQGDLILTHRQKKAFYSRGRYANTGLLSTITRWPKMKGYVWVPYTFKFSDNFSKLTSFSLSTFLIHQSIFSTFSNS